jgi:hypothetical protein
MADGGDRRLPASTKPETALDIAAFVGSAIPWIGGPVSNVLTGMSFGRKLERIRDVLEGLTTDLENFKSDVSENYVKTEEFEELLEQTLKRAAEERNDNKRRMYRAFLTETIACPGNNYDNQLRILRTIEVLDPDHVRVLNALAMPPDSNPGSIGSPNQTLARRLPGLGEDRIKELVNQLNDLRLTDLQRLVITMTGHGAADLRRSITPFGYRLMQYIVSRGDQT